MGSTSKAGLSCEEESGWTSYFDDFFNNQKSCLSISSSVVDSSSSLLSDATSFIHLAAQKVVLTHHQTLEEDFSKENKNVNFIRKRKKPHPSVVDLIIDDDVLQDTATSPLIISFKVFHFSVSSSLTFHCFFNFF